MKNRQIDDDWGLNLDWDIGQDCWMSPRERIRQNGIPEIGITPEQLQPDYNDQQEEAGRLAWEQLDSRTPPKSKQK